MTMGPYYTGNGDSSGLYGTPVSPSSTTYFEWFIFQEASTQPATPTGGSWDFTTNSGTAPTGWSGNPPANPLNTVWVSIGIVSSKASTAITWGAPGSFAYPGAGSILSGNGNPSGSAGSNNQMYIQLDATPQGIWFKESGTWVKLNSLVSGGTF